MEGKDFLMFVFAALMILTPMAAGAYKGMYDPDNMTIQHKN